MKLLQITYALSVQYQPLGLIQCSWLLQLLSTVRWANYVLPLICVYQCPASIGQPCWVPNASWHPQKSRCPHFLWGRAGPGCKPHSIVSFLLDVPADCLQHCEWKINKSTFFLSWKKKKKEKEEGKSVGSNKCRRPLLNYTIISIILIQVSIVMLYT